jgi:PAT family beta-lactamase induction signal transducer AmpG
MPPRTDSAVAWLKGLAIYAEPRVLAVLFLGFSSGIPLALTGQTLVVWMRETGVSLEVVGLFGAVGLPYTLKFLWAPLFDAVSVPLLGRWLGRRRAWLVTTQACLIAALLALATHDPATNLELTALLAFIVAFCSASQDIVVDAFRVESLEESRLAAGMANYVAGYRVALLVATAGAFEFAALMQGSGFAGDAGWTLTYAVLAMLLLSGTAAALLSKEPPADDLVARDALPFRRRFVDAVVSPFVEFMTRPGWLAILLFVVLFKFGDALAGVMTAPFVLDLGFDKTDYGRIVKLFGFAATLLGGFAGGALYQFLGPLRGLWLAGLVQMASNLLFVWQAHMGEVMWALIVTIGGENFTGGFATVIFVAYLSGLCRNRAYTATQYALLSALAAVSRTLLSTSSGFLAEGLGWAGYYALTTAAALPGLLLLWWLARHYAESFAAAPSAAK